MQPRRRPRPSGYGPFLGLMEAPSGAGARSGPAGLASRSPIRSRSGGLARRVAPPEAEAIRLRPIPGLDGSPLRGWRAQAQRAFHLVARSVHGRAGSRVMHPRRRPRPSGYGPFLGLMEAPLGLVLVQAQRALHLVARSVHGRAGSRVMHPRRRPRPSGYGNGSPFGAGSRPGPAGLASRSPIRSRSGGLALVQAQRALHFVARSVHGRAGWLAALPRRRPRPSGYGNGSPSGVGARSGPAGLASRSPIRSRSGGLARPATPPEAEAVRLRKWKPLRGWRSFRPSGPCIS